MIAATFARSTLDDFFFIFYFFYHFSTHTCRLMMRRLETTVRACYLSYHTNCALDKRADRACVCRPCCKLLFLFRVY